MDTRASFGFPPFRDGPFDSIEVLRDPHVLLVAADSPLADARRALTLRRIENYR